MDKDVNNLPACHTNVAAKPQILLNLVYFFKCVASCLSFILFHFETPYRNRIQKSNDKNRLSDIRLQKKSVHIPKLVLEQQQKEPVSLEVTHRVLRPHILV